MQGYDSYFMDTDIQIGGTDQTFNMQAGRTLQKLLRDKESYVLANVFLEGTDGRKMSKSWGNAIWLDDNPSNMYAKAMAIVDEFIINYFTLATNISLEKIKVYEKRLKTENPIKVKKELAHQIVSELHDQKSADEAQENFEKTVQHKEMPEEIQVFTFDIPELNIIDVLIHTKLSPSKSEAKRLIEQGGVSVDGKIIKTPNEIIKLRDERVIRIGKKNFAKLKLISR
jgi:tyrosyl-tRNA synthetase